MANTYRWNTTSGDWATAANWLDTTSATPGPPTSVDEAVIDATGTYTVTIASAESFAADTVTLAGAGDSLDVAGSLSVNSLYLGGSATAPTRGSGDVLLSGGGQLQSRDGAYVWQGSTLSVDATSAVDLGAFGTYVLGAVDVESGNTLAGNGLVSAAVVNNGTVESFGTVLPTSYTASTLEITGDIIGTGMLDLLAYSIMKLDGSVATTQTISFPSVGAGDLILNAPVSSFVVPIINLNSGDRIDFDFAPGTTITSAVYSAGAITVETTSGTYMLTNVSFAANASTQLFYGLDSATGEQGIQVAPPFVNWTGGVSTDLGTAGNWQGDAVPNAIDSASFFGGGIVTGTGSVLSLNFSGPGTTTFSGANLTVAGQPGVPYLPYAIGFNGNVTFDKGATLTAGGTTNIGASGGATVTVENGSTVTTAGDSFGNPGQAGTLVVTGLGSKWVDQIIPAANGYYSGFLTLGQSAPANGLSGGIGVLQVLNSGSVSTGGPGLIGFAVGTHGTATVDGAGSQWSLNDGLTVGNQGSGTLTVSDSAVVDTGNSLNVGNNGGGSGYVTIETNGLLEDSSTFDTIGNNASSYGSLEIDAHGTFENTAAGQTNGWVLDIGDNGTGSVTITGVGALLTLGNNPLAVGQSTGAQGTLTISNGGSAVANSESGNALAGVSLAKYGTAIVTITGQNSQLTAGGGIQIGRGGTASLAVESSGSLAVINDLMADKYSGYLEVGYGNPSNSPPTTGGAGTLLVESGGSVTTSGDILVGYRGDSGSIDLEGSNVTDDGRMILGSGTVVSGSTYSGSGALFVGSGSTLDIFGQDIAGMGTSDLLLGNSTGNTIETGSKGSVDVSGGVLNAENSYINIGNYGSGLFSVDSGGTVTAVAGYSTDAATLLGSQSTGEGMLTISGTGSKYTATGDVVVGNFGSGILLVSGGGSLATGNSALSTAGIDVGHYAGSSGEVTVSGIGSQFSDIGTFRIGGNGTTDVAGGVGSMTIEAGGLVTTQLEASDTTSPAAAQIAASTGTDGSSVSVTGANSTWQITGTLQVGYLASGTLDVTSGGTVTAGAVDLGSNSSGSGNVSVVGTAGTASFATIAGQLTIGDAGIGELSVLNGGTVTAATTIEIGAQAGSSGNVVIEGAGSELSTNTLDLTSTVNVGVLGTAVVTLGSGTHLDTSNINIGANGVINSFGGTIDPVTLTNTGVLGGTGLFNGSIHNLGTVYASGGTYEVTGSIDQGPGMLELETGGTLELGGPVSSGQTVDFTASGGLILNDVGGFNPGVVEGGSGTDGTIDVSVPGATGTLDGTTFTIYGASQQPLTSFQVSGGIDLTVIATCFSQGTRISTTRGMVAVEDLSEGDSVLTANGAIRTFKWLGHRRVQTRNHPRPQDIMPVRVMAHAFAESQPSRDLYLSPDHSVFVGGVLIPVRYLLNGTTISQLSVDTVTYWHVELPNHDIILAEGLPCESYLETGNRGAFANGGTAVQMNPEFARSVWDAKGCAPLTMRGPKVETARAHLLARLPALGWRLTATPDLRFLANGRDPVEPQVFGDWCCIALPDGVSTLRITSRHSPPAETDPTSFDWRRLGVALTHLKIDDEPIPLEDPRFIRGWHSPESGLRWSDGAGDLRVVDARIVELRFAPGLIRHAVPMQPFQKRKAA